MKCMCCHKEYRRPTTYYYHPKCYKWMVFKRKLKKVLEYVLGISIILLGYLFLNFILWAIETYVN